MSAQIALLADDLRVPAKLGRPSVYTDELGIEICQAIAKGLPLYKLCEERAHWPERQTIYRWADERPAFRDMFARARELKAHLFGEEIINLADNASPEMVRVAELQIKTRQWLAGKLAKADYGDQAGPAVQVNTQVNLAPFADSAVAKLEQITDRSNPKRDLAAT